MLLPREVPLPAEPLGEEQLERLRQALAAIATAAQPLQDFTNRKRDLPKRIEAALRSLPEAERLLGDVIQHGKPKTIIWQTLEAQVDVERAISTLKTLRPNESGAIVMQLSAQQMLVSAAKSIWVLLPPPH